jgi:hypothetical protein
LTASSRRFRLVFLAVLGALVLALVPVAFAGKGGGSGTSGGGGGKHGGGGTGPTYSGTITKLVLVDPTASGEPQFNHTITFTISSNAPYPSVRVQCYQGGVEVYQKTNGYSASWLWGQNYGLAGPSWTGGAANCVATLFDSNVDGSNQHVEATMNFNASA